MFVYFYPRSPCGERRQVRYFLHMDNPISIHALLAESDVRGPRPSWGECLFLSTLSLRRATRVKSGQQRSPHNFYPRSPCGERRLNPVPCQYLSQFLSTLSLRRATRQRPPAVRRSFYFYPRSPCGERQGNVHYMGVYEQISIHALLAESDQRKQSSQSQHPEFLSTLSLRRATSSPSTSIIILDISIHALLAESDGWRMCLLPATKPDFYPRSPCGERLQTSMRRSTVTEFLSTLSLRRATHIPRSVAPLQGISIHALLAESDLPRDCGIHRLNNFYPRSPCGERPAAYRVQLGSMVSISIHALLAESDLCWCWGYRPLCHFYPRSPCGERRAGSTAP